MRTRRAAVAITLAALSLTACSSGEADVAACKAAMRQQYEDAATASKEGTRPAACAGVDDKTLQRLAGEVLTEKLGEEMGEVLGTPTP
ncbi:hypothetical protein ACLF6K_37445 [Streptomyces xanthophaeus]|uniref:hypothetical protein n=1 Tax=Streptomyces xanthophaeus TaxID=67385 RepID=UPI00398F9573